nr:MAG TPA: hypothetical protein [Bacteriophage sp.]DAX77745.1 MAG TPA: hypothetical protein [Caudoviricetes sp.]
MFFFCILTLCNCYLGLVNISAFILPYYICKRLRCSHTKA